MFIFLKDEGCLRVTVCRCAKSTLWGRILTSPHPDESALASALHHFWQCCSSLGLCCGCSAVHTHSAAFFCLFFSRWRSNVISQVYSASPRSAPLSVCPSACLSLSLYSSFYLDGACLLCFITLSSIFQRHSHTFITKLHLIKDDLPRLFLAH